MSSRNGKRRTRDVEPEVGGLNVIGRTAFAGVVVSPRRRSDVQDVPTAGPETELDASASGSDAMGDLPKPNGHKVQSESESAQVFSVEIPKHMPFYAFVFESKSSIDFQPIVNTEQSVSVQHLDILIGYLKTLSARLHHQKQDQAAQQMAAEHSPRVWRPS